MAQRLAYLEAKELKEAAEYDKFQEPKYTKFVEELVASKIPVTEEQKTGFRQAFCDPRFKAQAATFEAQYNQMVELRASKTAADAKIAALEEEKKQNQAVISKTHESLNASRTQFANALNTPGAADAAAKEDEQRRKQHTAEVNAGRSSLNLNEIMCPPPALGELDFLKSHGYTSEVNVNASKWDSYGGGRPFARSVPAPPVYNHHHWDAQGNLNMPASGRNIPGCDVVFAWMVNEEKLREGDLSDIVKINAARNVCEKGETDRGHFAVKIK